MGYCSMIHSYFVHKDKEEQNFNHNKETEPKLVIYNSELVVEGE